MGASDIFNFFDKPDATPNVKEFKLPDFTQGFTDFNKQKDLIPGLQETATAGNNASNSAYQSAIFGLAPGLKGALSSLSNQSAQLSQGLIPQDVADQVTRNRAYQNFSSGIAPQGGQGQGLTARDLGLTSLNLINQGNQLAGSTLQMSQALTPNNLSVNQLLFTPGQLLSRADQQAQIDYGIASQNQAIDFQNNQRVSPFTSLLQNTVASFVSKPFTQFQEMQNLEANAPNMAAGAASSCCGGQPPAAPLGSSNSNSIMNQQVGTPGFSANQGQFGAGLNQSFNGFNSGFGPAASAGSNFEGGLGGIGSGFGIGGAGSISGGLGAFI